MWARIVELLFAFWLLMSRFIFSYGDFSSFLHWSDLLTGCTIASFALLSFIKRLNKMHLAQVFPIGWLLYVSYSYPALPLPFALQNYILIGFLLLMFCVIPSHASNHPQPWEEFLKDL